MDMRRLIFIIALFLSGSATAHEILVTNQLLKINRQNETGYQTNVVGKATLSPNWEVGLLGNYIERFGLYETRLGGLASYRPNQTVLIEARYLKSETDVKLLPLDQYSVSFYQAFSDGLSPFLTYQNSIYSITNLQTIRLGVEIEKIKNLIIIPNLLIGQAKFNDPSEFKEVNSLGLKVMYSVEQQYAFQVFGSKGIEASQGVVGQFSTIIETKTIGIGASYFVRPDLKVEGIFDYTDFTDKKFLKNQFLTSTLNLVWNF